MSLNCYIKSVLLDRGVGRLVVTAIWTYFKVCVLFYRGVCTWSVTAVRRPTRCINPYMAGGLMVRQEPKAVIKSQSVDWHWVVTHTALSVITQNTVPRTLQGSKEHTHKYVLCFNMKIIWKILFWCYVI